MNDKIIGFFLVSFSMLKACSINAEAAEVKAVIHGISSHPNAVMVQQVFDGASNGWHDGTYVIDPEDAGKVRFNGFNNGLGLNIRLDPASRVSYEVGALRNSFANGPTPQPLGGITVYAAVGYDLWSYHHPSGITARIAASMGLNYGYAKQVFRYHRLEGELEYQTVARYDVKQFAGGVGVYPALSGELEVGRLGVRFSLLPGIDTNDTVTLDDNFLSVITETALTWRF